jgi:hypothetical protein
MERAQAFAASALQDERARAAARALSRAGTAAALGLAALAAALGAALRAAALAVRQGWREAELATRGPRQRLRERLSECASQAAAATLKSLRASRRSGWLRSRRNRLAVCAAVLVLLLLALRAALHLVLGATLLVTEVVVGLPLKVPHSGSSAAADSGASGLSWRAEAGSSSLAAAAMSMSPEELQARVEAQVKVVLSRRLEDGAADRARQLKLSNEFEAFERSQARAPALGAEERQQAVAAGAVAADDSHGSQEDGPLTVDVGEAGAGKAAGKGAAGTPRRPVDKAASDEQRRRALAKQVAGLRSQRRVVVVAEEPPADESDVRGSHSSSKSRLRHRKSTSRPATEPHPLESALLAAGYGGADGAGQVGWVLAPGLECSAAAVASAASAAAAAARSDEVVEVAVLCEGGSDWVGHIGHKGVLDQRLRGLDASLQRLPDCIAASDFMPATFFVDPSTDLRSLEHELRAEAGLGRGGAFVLKRQRGQRWEAPPSDPQRAELSLPAVTTDPVKAIRALQRRAKVADGLLVQPYRSPLLWEGRKFSLRSWALVLGAGPLVALYHDGVVLRSLERHPSAGDAEQPQPHSAAHHAQRSSFARDARFYAGVTTRQAGHSHFATRAGDAVGCLADLQAGLAHAFPSGEVQQQYTELLLRPYLKRVTLFTLRALRRERHHASPRGTFPVMQLCLDFTLDSSWNVLLMDVQADCNAATNGAPTQAPCASAQVRALGQQTVEVVEQVLLNRRRDAGQGWLHNVELGSFQVLVDESAEPAAAAPAWTQELCKRSAYQAFRERQTFSKRAVQALLPADGRPRPGDFARADDRPDALGPWKCPICGYLNGARARTCDLCGGAAAEDGADHAGHASHDASHMHTGFERDLAVAAGLRAENAALEREGRREPAWRDWGTVRPSEGEAKAPAAAADIDRYFADHDARRGAQQPGLHDTDRPAAHTELCAGKPFELRESSELVGGASELEPLRAATVHSCCGACATEPRCAGFTFSPGTFRCSLYSFVAGFPFPAKGVISGVLALSGSPTDDGAPRGRTWRHQQEQQQQQQQQQPHQQQAAPRYELQTAQRERYKMRLTDIFMDHDPSKLAKVDALLDRYRGNEERFLQRTEEQYHAIEHLVQERKDDRGALSGGSGGVAGPARDAHGFTAGEYRERIEQILRANDPARLEQIDEMLVYFAGRELELADYLIGKYRDSKT